MILLYLAVKYREDGIPPAENRSKDRSNLDLERRRQFSSGATKTLYLVHKKVLAPFLTCLTWLRRCVSLPRLAEGVMWVMWRPHPRR